MSFNKFDKVEDKSFRNRYRVQVSNDGGNYWQKYPRNPDPAYFLYDDAFRLYEDTNHLHLVAVRLVEVSEKWFDGHGWVEVGTEVISAKGKV
jgi:hypothetical protein